MDQERVSSRRRIAAASAVFAGEYEEMPAYSAVRQGKALYAGISSYSPAKTAEAAAILRRLGTRS